MFRPTVEWSEIKNPRLGIDYLEADTTFRVVPAAQSPLAMMLEIPNRASAWKFSVQNMQKIYAIDNPIVIETLTTNRTEQPQRFLKGYKASEFRVSITGPDGKQTQLLPGDADKELPPINEGSRTIRPITVKPNASYAQAFKITEHYKFTTIGTYRISISRFCGPVISMQNQETIKGADVFTENAEFEIKVQRKTNDSVKKPIKK